MLGPCGHQHEDQKLSMRVKVVMLRLVVILRSTQEPVQCPVSIVPECMSLVQFPTMPTTTKMTTTTMTTSTNTSSGISSIITGDSTSGSRSYYENEYHYEWYVVKLILFLVPTILLVLFSVPPTPHDRR